MEQFSPDAQMQTIEQSCAMKGWKLVKVFKEGRSAKEGNNRPELAKALDFVEVCNADVFIAYKLDRFTRSVVDGASILKRLRDKGKHLVSASDGIDTTSMTGDLLCKLLVLLAEFERERMRERVMDARAAAEAEGRHPGGGTAYG